VINLQRRLSESRRAATIGAVTQGIAHNLNNLLGVVIGYLDLVKAYHDKPELVKKNVAHVEDAVQRIVAIIKQLSSLVVKARVPLIPGNLSRLIENAVQRFQTDNRVTASVVIENPLGEFHFDTNFEVYEDVLSKILINAWEAYADKPAEARPIWIRTELLDKPGDGKYLVVHIEDRGVGIDPAIRDHVFEPFISSKHTVGVGMGLTVARHALRNLGGEVTLSDRPGGGTIVTLTHPLEKRTRLNDED
jgi:two-component system, sensor histidine kinase and response regulator